MSHVTHADSNHNRVTWLLNGCMTELHACQWKWRNGDWLEGFSCATCCTHHKHHLDLFRHNWRKPYWERNLLLILKAVYHAHYTLKIPPLLLYQWKHCSMYVRMWKSGNVVSSRCLHRLSKAIVKRAKAHLFSACDINIHSNADTLYKECATQ